MKQITMQEAMRAVADGKEVIYEHPYGGKGMINDHNDAFFAKEYTYFIEETVKVALFRNVNYYHISPFAHSQEIVESDDWVQISDWVEIEVIK